jgi:predicted O-methyltransferase YrrM
MSRKSIQLDEQVYNYLLSVSLRESQILLECREETAKLPMARMQIAPEQGQFISFLIKSLHIKKALEIGVYTGYSSLSIATALPDDGFLDACDIDPEITAIAKKYWDKANVAEKISLHIGPAIETLDKLIEENQSESYDFAFIDAHKPEYIDYYERTLKLIRSGGVILIDNVLWSGSPADNAIQDEDTVAIRKFNEHLLKDERVLISMLPVADGITLALKN